MAQEQNRLLLRYWIRDEFTGRVAAQCNMKGRQCRGGSTALYKLLVQSPSSRQYINTDKDHLQIVSGMGHTFIRYKDDANKQYIYIDPTIAQFVPVFDGIFVGSAEELFALSQTAGSKLNITDYVEDPRWTGVSHPPLTIETQMMSAGKRRRKTLKRARRMDYS
jgi:hypothetical protein